MMGNVGDVAELVERCPDYAELVDGQGRNFLHCAIEHDQENVVRFICRDGALAALLNAMDFEGSTPLHLAVKYGRPRMVSLLLQNMSVEVGITNRDGLTAADLAYRHLDPGLLYFLNPRAAVKNCLYWTRAPVTLGAGGDHVHLHSRIAPAMDEEDPKDIDGITATGTIASVLIATVTFAAAFTVPGGYAADGTAVLARRFAFRAFVVTDTAAFLCSIVATCFLVYGGAGQVPRAQRSFYQRSASGLLPPAAQLMVAAFAFGIHAVLGEPGNRVLVTLVYVLALGAVLLCFPGIWAPFYPGKAIWRRAGWRGLINVHRRPASLHELVWLFITSFLFKSIARPLFAVLISAAFVVSIALDIALAEY